MTMSITTIGLDLAKTVFQVHGADAAGNPVCKKRLRRGQMIQFFADLTACRIGMEACGSAHYQPFAGRGLQPRLKRFQTLRPVVSEANKTYERGYKPRPAREKLSQNFLAMVHIFAIRQVGN